MKADSVAISKVFSGGGDIHYVLPYFQREYTWGREQWKTLLADALAVYEESPSEPDGDESHTSIEHFLGSIVVVLDGMRGGTMSAFKLVDGQQRLTSTTLLLKALAALIEPTHAHLSRKIDRFLINADETGDLYYKLLPTTKAGDRSAYQAVIRGEQPPSGDSKIVPAFKFFKQELNSAIETGLDPERFFRVVLNSFQVVFINLDRDESPYRIFESLNAKGKPLTQGDLVRNYVAMKLPAAHQERAFTQSWSKIEGLLRESRTVGRLTELTAFLRHYLAMHSGVLCEESHVYARFRDRAEKEFSGDGQLEAELHRLAQFADLYDKLLRPAGWSDPDIVTALERLNTLETSTGYPFLLRVFEAYGHGGLSRQGVLDVLRMLENYMVRRFVTREPVTFLNRLFPKLWAQLDQTDLVGSLRSALGAHSYPTDTKVLRALKERRLYERSETTRKRTTLVLEALNRELSAGTGGLTILDGSPTIEHIMPQTLSAPWKESLGVMGEQIHRDLLHTLGNLTLVTSEWNSVLSNSDFSVKQEKLAKHALRLNSDYFDGTLAKWSRDEILERAETLGFVFLRVWPPLVPEAGVTTAVSTSPGNAIAQFHFAAVERVAHHLGIPLLRASLARFQSGDGKSAVVGMCSKPYKAAEERGQQFWFGLRVSQRDFLRDHAAAWVAFECDVPERVVLLPLADLEPYLPHLNVTEGSHWHVVLIQAQDRMWLNLPLLQRREDFTKWLVPEAASQQGTHSDADQS